MHSGLDILILFSLGGDIFFSQIHLRRDVLELHG